MPTPVRPRLASRYGQATLDPSRPLYVRRRISRGAAGALVPGQVFDASDVAPHRLRNLYRNGHISHDPPKGVTVAETVAAALARAEKLAEPVLEQPAPLAEPVASSPAPVASPAEPRLPGVTPAKPYTPTGQRRRGA